MVYEGLRDDKSAAEVRREVLHPKLYSCVLPIDSRSAQIPDLRTYAELANAESTDAIILVPQRCGWQLVEAELVNKARDRAAQKSVRLACNNFHSVFGSLIALTSEIGEPVLCCGGHRVGVPVYQATPNLKMTHPQPDALTNSSRAS